MIFDRMVRNAKVECDERGLSSSMYLDTRRSTKAARWQIARWGANAVNL